MAEQERDAPYHINHSNVDGAGRLPGEYDRVQEAITVAIRLQMKSDAGGNPWGYRYHVHGQRRDWYTTYRGETLPNQARPEALGTGVAPFQSAELVKQPLFEGASIPKAVRPRTRRRP